MTAEICPRCLSANCTQDDEKWSSDNVMAMRARLAQLETLNRAHAQSIVTLLAELDAAIDESQRLHNVDEYRTRLAALYNELLMAVACKFPNESRHQTALRYIRERESREVCGPAKSLAGSGEKASD